MGSAGLEWASRCLEERASGREKNGRGTDSPPRIAPTRAPPEWYEDGAYGVVWSDEGMMQRDPLAQVAPEYEQLDQQVSW